MADEKKTAEVVDLSMPRIVQAPTSSIIRPATSVDVSELALNLATLENNQQAAPLGIPVDKPKEFEWFRTHPDAAYRKVLMCLDFKAPNTNGKELHIIHPKLAHLFADTSAGPYQLYTLMNRVGNLRICEVKLPQDGKWNEYNRTRQMALDRGIVEWTRMWANLKASRYESQPAPVKYPDPIWPDLSYGDLLQIAFGALGRIIDSEDHIVVKIMRGLL
jgi:hypothetical protein